MTAGYTEHFFATQDGPRLEYRDYSPTSPESGPPILCLHGLTRNLRDFEELAPLLAAMGRRVITTSQRGRGRSDADPEPARYNPAVYTADMIALLDLLMIDRAVFVGTSMGGLMTMIAAYQSAERIAAAVLNDVGPVVSPEGLKRIRSYVGGAESVGAWQEAAAYCRKINGTAFPTETGDAFWQRFAGKVFREFAPGEIRLEYDAAISIPFGDDPPAAMDLWPLFDALANIPTLLIRGALSDVLAEETVEEMRTHKPDMAVVNVPEIGHAPFLTEPAAFDAIVAFIGAS